MVWDAAVTPSANILGPAILGSPTAAQALQARVGQLISLINQLGPQVAAQSGSSDPTAVAQRTQFNAAVQELLAILVQALQRLGGQGPLTSLANSPAVSGAPNPGVNALSTPDLQDMVGRIRGAVQHSGVPPSDVGAGYSIQDSFTGQAPGINASTDGRFMPFGVKHTDIRGRRGRYVDQPSTGSAFTAIRGPGGQPEAVAYTAGLTVDTDGVGSHHGDGTASGRTSLKVNGRSANADQLPYVALPPGFADQIGAKLGDVVQVTGPNGKTAYAIYADNSDDRMGRHLGEGSRRLLQDLGYSGKTLDPNNGGLEGGVKFVAFPGSGDALGTTQAGWPTDAQVQAWGQRLTERLTPAPPQPLPVHQDAPPPAPAT